MDLCCRFACLDLNLGSGLALLADGGGSDPPVLYAWPLCVAASLGANVPIARGV